MRRANAWDKPLPRAPRYVRRLAQEIYDHIAENNEEAADRTVVAIRGTHSPTSLARVEPGGGRG